MAPVLDVIIVNWNAGPLLHQCLESIAAAARSYIDLKRVVIVDNASIERPLQSVDTAGLPTVVIRNEQNRGFATACNQGASGSVADYLLFLNPDTTLRLEALARPIVFMEQPQNSRIGIVGIQLVDDNGNVARTCARFPTPGRLLATMLGLDRAAPGLFPAHFMIEWDHRQSGEVDQVMGAYFMVRRSMFEALGGFDERFFVYFEEVDLSVRAHALGWRSCYLATAQAYHHGSGDVKKHMPALRLFYSLRSRMQYGYKHFNPFTATLVALGTLFVEPLSRLLLASVRRSPSQFADVLKAYALLWRALPSRLGTRRQLPAA